MDHVNLLTLPSVICKAILLKTIRIVHVHKYSEEDAKKMLEFLIDNIYAVFGKQSVGILMVTN